MTERTWQLRAMSVAELLDETIHLYRYNFLTFVGIVAILQVPITLLSTTITSLWNTPIGILLSVVELVLLNNLITAALAWAISRCYLQGVDHEP